MRDEDFATIYTSDTTYMTKLNKLCKTSPDMYSLIADTGSGKTYCVADKTLISFRAKKREISDEQKIAAGERMKQYQASRRSQDATIFQKSNVQLKIWRIFKMLREMMRPKLEGQTIKFNLAKWGYKNFIVECAYHFDKREGKYSLSMWLKRNDLGDRMRLSSKKVDTQYISGTKETIIENICRIVHQAATVADESGEKYFERFVERYEYESKCFERGNELFEQERLNKANDDKN